MDYTRVLLSVGLLFCFGAVTDVTAVSTVQTLTAVEGGNVTFWRGLDNQTHVILYHDNVTLLNFDNGSKPPMQNNIHVENGSIIMINVHQNDSEVIYKLEFYTPVETIYSFKLNVTKRQHQVYDYTTAQPTQGSDSEKTRDHTAAYVVFGIWIVAVLFVFVVVTYRERERLRNKICRKSPSNDLTSVRYCGPTSHHDTV